ncbi:MAG: exodeoxyribonuclease VII small subunit, partial [Pseudomonadota bacterium]
MARQENAQPAAAHSGEIGALSFEQALQELERIVGQLERGDVGLEHSISLY